MNAANLTPAVKYRIDGLPGTEPAPSAPLRGLLDDPQTAPRGRGRSGRTTRSAGLPSTRRVPVLDAAHGR